MMFKRLCIDKQGKAKTPRTDDILPTDSPLASADISLMQGSIYGRQLIVAAQCGFQTCHTSRCNNFYIFSIHFQDTK